jgi:hypothetical protein
LRTVAVAVRVTGIAGGAQTVAAAGPAAPAARALRATTVVGRDTYRALAGVEIAARPIWADRAITIACAVAVVASVRAHSTVEVTGACIRAGRAVSGARWIGVIAVGATTAGKIAAPTGPAARADRAAGIVARVADAAGVEACLFERAVRVRVATLTCRTVDATTATIGDLLAAVIRAALLQQTAITAIADMVDRAHGIRDAVAATAAAAHLTWLAATALSSASVVATFASSAGRHAAALTAHAARIFRAVACSTASAAAVIAAFTAVAVRLAAAVAFVAATLPFGTGAAASAAAVIPALAIDAVARAHAVAHRVTDQTVRTLAARLATAIVTTGLVFARADGCLRRAARAERRNGGLAHGLVRAAGRDGAYQPEGKRGQAKHMADRHGEVFSSETREECPDA